MALEPGFARLSRFAAESGNSGPEALRDNASAIIGFFISLVRTIGWRLRVISGFASESCCFDEIRLK
ncbi:MAG: hypothetical protein IJ523_07550 [Succinivibrionaceae bacterium]|nr:hypothetical protein [Succinivibrionaceae bacterium]